MLAKDGSKWAKNVKLLETVLQWRPATTDFGGSNSQWL